MDNKYLAYSLNEILHATEFIRQNLEDVENTVGILLGCIKFDVDNDTTFGGEQAQLSIPQIKQADDDVLEFTDKEISKMPKFFRTLFRTNEVRAHIRLRQRGNSTTYEVRCRSKGHNISASGKTVEEAKENFIRKLNDSQTVTAPIAPDIPTKFDEFTLYYFEKFRTRKVKEDTYKKDVSRLKNHILPHFGSIKVHDITPQMCQQLIDKLVDSGLGKTAAEVFSLLNQTFDTAIRHHLIDHNPLDIVIHFKHERKHGIALTVDEEKLLLDSSEEPYRTMFAIGLYTGIRPNEYATVRIVGEMIYARNSKRKHRREETKRIPITPMLRPYINADTVLPKLSPDQLRNAFNKIFGDKHILYDLRTTFYTRCKMCNVAEAAREEFMGHSSGELGNAYTDLPDDYLIKEGEKLSY